MEPSEHRFWVDWLSHFLRAGIKDVVVCPGSRSAPPLQALITLPAFTLHSVVDERSAGYQALGMAQALGRPVIVLTTSGTAAANLLPAACEAFFSEIPLLLLTADRPPEWIGQQDNQAIHQSGLFGSHVRGTWNLPVEADKTETAWHAHRIAREAIAALRTQPAGPVHINVPLREPLYVAERPETTSVEPGTFTPLSPKLEIEPGLIEALDNSSHPLLLVGQRRPHDPFPPRFPVTTSGDLLANLGYNDAPEFWLSNPQAHPDLVITAGGAFVSKFVRQTLRTLPFEHWHIGPRSSVEVFQRPVRFCTTPHLELPFEEFTNPSFEASVQRGRDRRNSWLVRTESVEVLALHAILAELPERSTVHLGNSLPVRLACLLADTRPDTQWFSNRGTSGIDGVLSTAIGHALATPDRTHVVCIGELSFGYDRNALWRDHLPSNLKIVVLNNGGGAIFKALPGPDLWGDDLNRWTTPHSVPVRSIALDAGCDYAVADHHTSALQAWLELSRSDAPTVIEVRADGSQTANAFRELLAILREPHTNPL